MKRPKFKGPLAQKIKITEPEPLGQQAYSEWIGRAANEALMIRLGKMILLSKHPDFALPGAEFDLSTIAGQATFYREMALQIAQVYIMGFQLKDRTKQRDAQWLAQIYEAMKTHPRLNKNLGFEFYLRAVKKIDPEMRRPGNAQIAKQRARSLRNMVSKERVALRKKADAEARKRAEAKRRRSIH